MHSALSPFRHLAAMALAPLLLLGCNNTAEEPVSNEPATAEVAKPEPPVVAPQPPLDREGLIQAALGAATAAALGQEDAAAQSELKGRRFELRMRFGCPVVETAAALNAKAPGDIKPKTKEKPAGSRMVAGERKPDSNPKAVSGWTYDEAKGVLRARLEADLDAEKLRESGLIGDDYEGAVGFTIPHPWMLSAGCPDSKFDMGGPAISLVQLFTKTDSRVQRPEPSHEVVVPMKPEELPSQGLSLVISGRLESLPGGGAIRCSAAGNRPSCIISTLIDRIAIEDPARDRIVLGEWGAS